MLVPYTGFIGPSYRARSQKFDCQEAINLYAELSATGTSKSVAALIGTPGLIKWLALGGALGGVGVRGVKIFDRTRAVAVVGDKVHVITLDASNNPTSTLLGTVTYGSTPVSMASNGVVMMLVTGPAGYVLDLNANTITPISNPAFIGADTVTFIDGYFVFNKTGTGQFQITGLYTTGIDALDFATAEGAPDLLLSLLADHRELWLFGETTTEVYFNSGNPDFPFERIQGAFIEQGCAAKFSPARADNCVYWLSADERGKGTVQRAQGYAPQRVSTHAVEYDIAQMSRIDDAVAYTYQQEGHSWYVLNFPTGNRTWAYDATTDMWFKRAYRKPLDGSLNRQRQWVQMQFAGKTIVGDYETGDLYIMDLDTFVDGDPTALIPRIRIGPHIQNGLKEQFFASFQVDMQVGVGLNGTGYGSDPEAWLRWSDDGGYSWSNQIPAKLGKIGQTGVRAKWRRLGRGRDRVYEVTITDPVRVVMVGAMHDMMVGTT